MKKTYGNPVILDSEGHHPELLQRINLGAGTHSEDWLQKLIFERTELLPIHDIEPGFGELVSVAREAPCGHGFIDNLYVTPVGDIVLVETKLWRNVQARREVVAQTLDYIAALTRMDYAAFEAAINRGVRPTSETPKALYDCMRDRGDEADEARFVDTVSRNLKRGRMLALVVGDGIRQEAEALGALLQSHAGAHFTFALVELVMWRDPTTGAIIAMPGTLAQTVMIERGIVVMRDDRLEVGDLPTVAAATPGTGAKAHSITEEMYYEALANADPALPALLKDFLAQIEPLGVYPEFLAALNLKVEIGDRAKPITLGYITKTGKLWTSSIASSLDQQTGIAFNERLAPLIGGQVKNADERSSVLTTNGTSAPSIKMLLPDHRDAWVAAIENLLTSVAQKDREAA